MSDPIPMTDMPVPDIRLTEIASCAGCAAKLGPGDLSRMLQPLQGIFDMSDHSDLLVGLDSPDDSAVYRIDDERALIVTTDFFPPIVDDAYDYGAIAAANALSDVYAMGGRPLLALNIVCFPETLPREILARILRGGAEKVREAGAVIAGGHTVIDDEPKYGLAVIGEAHPDTILRKRGAQPGDVLVLSKPLGTGLITTAMKQGVVDETHARIATAGMTHLNRTASQVAMQYGVHAMTDITGYGLMGHSTEMARAGNVTCVYSFDALQWYDGAPGYAQDGIAPGGTGRNRSHFAQMVQLDGDGAWPEWKLNMLFDPQTSGGLLMAVSPEQAAALVDALHRAGERADRIGHVQPHDAAWVRVG